MANTVFSFFSYKMRMKMMYFSKKLEMTAKAFKGCKMPHIST